MGPSSSEDNVWWREPDTLRWIVLISLGGAVLRVAAMLDASGLPYFHYPLLDAAIFERGAARIAAGDLVLAEQISVMNPGYFYVLGLIRSLFGQGPWAVRFIQVAMGVCTIVLVFDAARRVFGKEKWALLPPALLAAYAPAIFFEQQVLGESTALMLHAAALDALLMARARRSVKSFAFVGMWIGLAALLRPTALFLLGPALLVVVKLPSARLKSATVLILAALIAIAPITLRNVVLIGEPVFIASHGGVNLWVGNGEGANGAFRIPSEAPGADSPETQFRAFRETASRATGRELSVSETDRYWTARTISWIASHPIPFIRLLVRKLHLFWNARELSDVYRYEFLYERIPTLHVCLRFGWIAPWALLGFFIALSKRSEEFRLVSAVALAECLGVVLVMVTARYRLTTVAPLLLLAGLAMKTTFDVIRRKDHRRAFIMALGLSITAIIAWPISVRDTRSHAWRELGEAWVAVGDIEAALDAYERSLDVDPTNTETREALIELRARRRTHEHPSRN